MSLWSYLKLLALTFKDIKIMYNSVQLYFRDLMKFINAWAWDLSDILNYADILPAFPKGHTTDKSKDPYKSKDS